MGHRESLKEKILKIRTEWKWEYHISNHGIWLKQHWEGYNKDQRRKSMRFKVEIREKISKPKYWFYEWYQ